MKTKEEMRDFLLGGTPRCIDLLRNQKREETMRDFGSTEFRMVAENAFDTGWTYAILAVWDFINEKEE